MSKRKGRITIGTSTPKVSDKEKLENTIKDMLKGFQYFTSSTTAVIGKTQDQVIALTIYSRDSYENEFNESFDNISDKHICISTNNSKLITSVSPVVIPDGLHSDTVQLVISTANAMAEKLCQAQEKHGYINGWKIPPDGEEACDGRNFRTREECLKALFRHLEKGDPIDCINYLAFMQANDWRTELPTQERTNER